MDFRELLDGELPQFLLEPEISCLEIAEDDAGSVLSLCCESVHLGMASSSSDIIDSDGMEFDLDDEVVLFWTPVKIPWVSFAKSTAFTVKVIFVASISTANRAPHLW